MTVQDDQRERELCRTFNLHWTPGHERGGTDATFKIKIGDRTLLVPVEVKSTTGSTVSTARDVGIEHIRKWRSHFWIIGYYSRGGRPELQKTLCLSPNDIEPWVASIEQKILPDFQIAASAARRVQMADLYAICGEKASYTISDARKLHKNQWGKADYLREADVLKGGEKHFSQEKMLFLLRLRSQYIAERGATLNNPHITKTFLDSFLGTNREIYEDWSSNFKTVVQEYLAAYPDHPFVRWE
ncbi:hypothetical protein [Massilia timonae]|uniref:Uncharacterized protein n=1 Tax=Massilia timonae TaxID=47229 RepID=A0A1S2NB48_9BURK|nr:hypothetical protein [Massilia timonae]OIJ42298.1 hypothetical protein LO55_1673 [Massilia timonae]